MTQGPDTTADDAPIVDPSKPPITHRNFVRYVSYMASHATKWAGECMDGDIDEPMSEDSLTRFTERMNGWLETINGR